MSIRTIPRRKNEPNEEVGAKDAPSDTSEGKSGGMTHRDFLRLVGATLGVGLASQLARPPEVAEAAYGSGTGFGGGDLVTPSLTVASSGTSSDGTMYLGNLGDAYIAFDGANLTIAPGSGNVGIGVSPSYALDVNGSIAIANNLGDDGLYASTLYLAGGDPNHWIFSTGTDPGNGSGNQMYFGEWGGNFHFYDTAIENDVMTLTGSQLRLGGTLVADQNGCYYV